jgi:hypothetical protein
MDNTLSEMLLTLIMKSGHTERYFGLKGIMIGQQISPGIPQLKVRNVALLRGNA